MKIELSDWLICIEGKIAVRVVVKGLKYPGPIAGDCHRRLPLFGGIVTILQKRGKVLAVTLAQRPADLCQPFAYLGKCGQFVILTEAREHLIRAVEAGLITGQVYG